MIVITPESVLVAEGEDEAEAEASDVVLKDVAVEVPGKLEVPLKPPQISPIAVLTAAC